MTMLWLQWCVCVCVTDLKTVLDYVVGKCTMFKRTNCTIGVCVCVCVCVPWGKVTLAT